MLQLVNAGHKSLADYATIATRGLMDEIRRLAEPLIGKRVVHLSATAFGGGVAEINYTLIPLMQDAGLEAEWRIIKGADEFWNVTKTIHNALQGNPQGLTEEQRQIFRRYQELNAQEFDDDYDFVIVHDPQPAGMIDYFPDSRASWIWRGHIDFSTPNQEVFDFVRRGEVFLVALDPTRGAEIQKTRPCVVVSPDDLNAHLRTVIVAPLTTGGQPFPFRVPCRFQNTSI